MTEKTVNAKVTMYGYPDNDPPFSATIAHPVIHQTASGTGTFEDPITFATDPRDIPYGTKIYVPYLQKYFINEDLCADAASSKSDGLHVDLWAGGSKATNVNALLAVEDANTRQSAQIILNAEPGHAVNVTPFDTAAKPPTDSGPVAQIPDTPASGPTTPSNPPKTGGTGSTQTSDHHAHRFSWSDHSHNAQSHSSSASTTKTASVNNALASDGGSTPATKLAADSSHSTSTNNTHEWVLDFSRIGASSGAVKQNMTTHDATTALGSDAQQGQLMQASAIETHTDTHASSHFHLFHDEGPSLSDSHHWIGHSDLV